MGRASAARRDHLTRATASSQYGAFNHKQGLSCGHTRDSLSRLVASGILRRPLPRVFVFAGTPKSWELDAMVGYLHVGEHSAISHGSAAALHGLYGFPRGYPIHLSVAGSLSGHPPSLLALHRGGDALLEEVGILEGIPVTSPRRTLLDLAAIRHPRLEDSFDTFIRNGGTSLGQLKMMLTDQRVLGRHGYSLLKRLVTQRSPETDEADSLMELDLDRLLRMRGEVAELQHPILLGNGITIHADLAFPKERVAIETDGGTHRRDEYFESDRSRDRGLAALGWLPMRVTSKQLDREQDGVVQSILDALAKRRRHT